MIFLLQIDACLNIKMRDNENSTTVVASGLVTLYNSGTTKPNDLLSSEAIIGRKLLRKFRSAIAADRLNDALLSTASSSTPATIVVSFFPSRMGASILYGTTEMGANPNLSWFGVIRY